MKKILTVICGLWLLLSLVACGSQDVGNETSSIESSRSSSGTVLSTVGKVVTNNKTKGKTTATTTPKSKYKPKRKPTAKPTPKPTAKPKPTSKPKAKKDNNMYRIQIVVGKQKFPTVLYKNKTTDALMDRLPMTLDMSDLNGNEKYFYFPDKLPTNSKKPSKIRTGDLMLFGTDCFVLFYESFSSSYSYTTLGYVEDPAGLAKALGNGNVQVSFNQLKK